MPRKRNPEPDMLQDALGAPIVPILVPGRHTGDSERRVDAYTPLPGGSPSTVGGSSKKKRGVAKTAEPNEAAGNRYDRFLDILGAYSGDEDAALAAVFELEGGVPEAQRRHDELLDELLKDVPESSIGDMIRRRHISTAARLTMLRRHMYSPNPAVSLKSIDMLNDMDNRPGQGGPTYETYVRAILEA